MSPVSPVDGLLRARETSGLVGLTLGPGDVSIYGVAPRMCVALADQERRLGK